MRMCWSLVADCAAKQVKALQLFTGRFSETGRPDAIDLERRLAGDGAGRGVRLIGPNCMGLLHPRLGVSFRLDMSREAGPIGFLSQSGNLFFELTHFGGSRGLRFSKAISYGNALDLSEADFLDYFAQDAETRVIGAYIEGVRDGRSVPGGTQARDGGQAGGRAEGRADGRRWAGGGVAHGGPGGSESGVGRGGRAGGSARGGYGRGADRCADRVCVYEA